MKMVKKILLGTLTVAAILAFASCKQADDPKKAINGSGNNYSIDWDNGEDNVYRAYNPTSFNHAGALVKVTFEKPDANNFSKMGVIFNLTENSDKSKNFCIIGLAAATGDKNFYVSRFSNITDIQASNFGATENAATGPSEKVEVGLTEGNKISTLPTAAADGSVSYYVYYKAFPNGATGTNGKGYYEYGIYSFTDTQAAAANAMMKKENTAEEASLSRFQSEIGVAPLKSGTITDAFDLNNGAVPQTKMAVYAMISPKKSLKGKWKYLDMYKEAEEIEE